MRACAADQTAAPARSPAFDMARLMTLGADWCNSVRRVCLGLHSIATLSHQPVPDGAGHEDPLRQRALVVPDKAQRVYNFHQQTLRAQRTGCRRRGRRSRATSRRTILRRTAKHQPQVTGAVADPAAHGACLLRRHPGLPLSPPAAPAAVCADLLCYYPEAIDDRASGALRPFCRVGRTIMSFAPIRWSRRVNLCSDGKYGAAAR